MFTSRVRAQPHGLVYGSRVQLRLLTEGDQAAVEAFLTQHRDTSMFLRANLRRRGFTYRGQPHEALYAAVFDGPRVIAVAAHCWNGMLLVQAPVEIEPLAKYVVEASGRKVTGFSGLRDQVQQARDALGLADAPAQLDGDEDLYVLALEALRDPPATSEPITCRPARAGERDELLRWRFAYEVELLGATDSESMRRGAAAFLDAQLSAGHAWVAVSGERLLSFSGFNAALPDIVQLGGIYTPPELRGRHYAKHAVAAQLTAARDRGVSRSVLFTDNPSAARCYQALGFRRSGGLSLVLLS